MLNIRTVGMKEFDAKLDRLRQKLPNQLPLFKAITAEMDKWETRLFDTEGQPVGGWAPLKPVMFHGAEYDHARIHYPKSAKAKKWGKRGQLRKNAKLLQDTRRGRASLKPKATSRSASVTTGIGYMVAHHKGGGHLPKRPVVPEYHQIREQVLGAAWAFLRLRLRESGL